MKKHIFISLLSALFAVTACGEKLWEEDLEKKTADAIRGYYEIESMTWHGSPVDLNNDGVALEDIMAEFEALLGRPLNDYVQRTKVDYGWEGSGGFRWQTIQLYLPIQEIEEWCYEKYLAGEPLVFYGDYKSFKCNYSIENDELTFYNTISTYGNDHCMDHDEIAKGGVTITSPEYGCLEFEVSYLFFDCAAGDLVRNRMTVRFRRVEYC